MTAPARVLQISDTHLLAEPGATLLGVDTAATLAAVLDQALARETPALLVASGDLSHEQPAAYQRFLTLVRERYQGPLLALPGNHDLGAVMAELVTADSVRLGDWEILAFDSHADGQAESAFEAAALACLMARVRASSARHLILVGHHPPLPVGCPWLDKDCIQNGAELLESCAADGRVRALLCGHVHQAWQGRHGRMQVLAVPSTCFQFAPRTPRFSIDRTAASGVPGYRWLTLNTDGSLQTEVGRLAGHPINIDLSDRS